MSFMSPDYLMNISNEKRDQLFRTTIQLGYQPETYDSLLLPDKDRYAGTYVLGVQGVGKSALLENMIAFDNQANNAIIVVDPHGDLMTHCLAALPPDRLPHTYLLDMEDEAYPFGVNVFAVGPLTTSMAHAQAVERIMHIFDVLWPDVLGQQGLPRYLRAATITFLANPGTTLVDMHTFLFDDQFRARLLSNVTDPTVRQFWQTQYDDLKEADRLRRVQPLIARLEALFMGRSLVRNIVGQRKTTINFRQAIENHEIIFVRLPIKTVAQDARLIGTMLMAQIHAAVFSFGNVPEAQRPGVSLYVDEFQHFATPDFAELFTEGRKFGVKLTLAHQYRAQLPAFLQDSTMTARTKICFQTTPEDGREMAHVFPAQEETMRPEDINTHPVEHLLTYGSDVDEVNVLIDTYLRPLQGQKRGNRVEVDVFQYDWINGKPLDKPRLPDPTPYLDNLLYQVMKSGDPDGRIPPGAIKGLANCGRGFYPQVRSLLATDRILTIETKFPRSLVVENADGTLRWTRRPESDTEQLFHLIFHLRTTMAVLAVEPIGKKSAPSTTIVGQMLTQLPRRAAFVRSAETVGVIYTNDTPKRVTGRELVTRAQTVLGQTRQKYCHPRTAIEQLFVQPTGNQAPATAPAVAPIASAPATIAMPRSRWEEV